MALKPVKVEPGPVPANAGTPPPATPEPAAPAAPKAQLRKRILLGVAVVAAAAAIWFGGDWLMNGRFNLTTRG